MGISFPFPTNMCKRKLHCCQIACFLWTIGREFISESSRGEFLMAHLCCEKGPYLPSSKPNLTVLCTYVRLKNRSTNMRETIITGEYAGRLESLLTPFLVVYQLCSLPSASPTPQAFMCFFFERGGQQHHGCPKSTLNLK